MLFRFAVSLCWKALLARDLKAKGKAIMCKLLHSASLLLIAMSFFSMFVNIQRSSNPLSDLGEGVVVPSLVCSLTNGVWVKLAFFLCMLVKWVFWISTRKTSSQCSFHERAEFSSKGFCHLHFFLSYNCCAKAPFSLFIPATMTQESTENMRNLWS